MVNEGNRGEKEKNGRVVGKERGRESKGMNEKRNVGE